MSLYCIYALSSFFALTLNTQHMCRQPRSLPATSREPNAKKDTQADRNIRDAMRYPILYTIQNQNQAPEYPGITITF
jgi:hypothetical protein